MFAKLFVAASLAILAVATPAPWGSSGSTTPNSCCTSTTTANDASFASLFKSLGIDVSDATLPIGLGCSPITVVGVSGTSCTNDPVSCDQIFARPSSASTASQLMSPRRIFGVGHSS